MKRSGIDAKLASDVDPCRPLLPESPDSSECTPWTPRERLPEESEDLYEKLVEWDRQLIALERQRRGEPAPATDNPPPPPTPRHEAIDEVSDGATAIEAVWRRMGPGVGRPAGSNGLREGA